LARPTSASTRLLAELLKSFSAAKSTIPDLNSNSKWNTILQASLRRASNLHSALKLAKFPSNSFISIFLGLRSVFLVVKHCVIPAFDRQSSPMSSCSDWLLTLEEIHPCMNCGYCSISLTISNICSTEYSTRALRWMTVIVSTGSLIQVNLEYSANKDNQQNYGNNRSK